MNQENPTHRLERKTRIRALLFFTLAVVAGAFAVFVVKVYLDRAGTANARAAQPIATTEVVVAAAEIPIGTQLASHHVRQVSWPAEHAPATGFSSVEEVLGRSTRQSLVPGEPILAGRLADPERGQGMAAILAEGSRAMAVKVDQVVGVAGFVQPGDYVDVITTMQPDDETKALLRSQAARISKIILQNIRVLAVGEHLATNGHEPMKVQVVTLEVQPEQAEKLALASQHGEIQLTMRSRIDQLEVPTAGISPLALLSPDDGTERASVQQDTQHEPRARSHARRRQRQAREPEPPSIPPPAKIEPQEPVVEILRGTRRIEERTLRRTADAN